MPVKFLSPNDRLRSRTYFLLVHGPLTILDAGPGTDALIAFLLFGRMGGKGSDLVGDQHIVGAPTDKVCW